MGVEFSSKNGDADIESCREDFRRCFALSFVWFHVVGLQENWTCLVSTRDNAETVMVCGAVNLRVVRICKELRKCV